MNTKTLTHSTAGIAPIFQRPASKTMLKQEKQQKRRAPRLGEHGD